MRACPDGESESRKPRPGSSWAVVAVLGLLFGTAATLLNMAPSDHVLDASLRRVAGLVMNSSAGWAGIAVLGGWLAGSTARSLVAGPAALVLAVVAYYFVGAAAGSENADGSVDQVTHFALVSLVAGPLLGAAGGRMRRRDARGLLAALIVPLGMYAETIWRAGVEVQADPARPLVDVILVALATAGVVAAVTRYVVAHRAQLARA
jgi:uncharacterized protein DUF6518